MANSEKSFLDREGRVRLLIAAVEGFETEFAPPDEGLSVAGLNALVAEVEAANVAVAALEVDHGVNASERAALVKGIRKTATRAVGYVKSNAAWGTPFKAVKMAADKLRNMRPPSKAARSVAAGADGDAGTEPGKRNKGEQAYVELEAHLSALIKALTACPGYNPPGAGISLTTFNGLLEQFHGLNTQITALKGELTTAREARRKLYYEGADCLQRRFQAVKYAVKGQYGQDSKEYAVVKGNKW